MPRTKVKLQQTYEVWIYKKHPSGIGSKFVKSIQVTEKPTWDNCDFFDATNGKWARWEK